ncbi:MAG: hypothetical protein IH987_20880 [Planctomycetes bacterium]|nr:hypothetical protein [Planctomycetota bacterium]
MMTAYVGAATIGQVYAGLRALGSSPSLDDGLVTQLQDLFAVLETACQHTDRALAEVTGKYFELPPAIEPPK